MLNVNDWRTEQLHWKFLFILLPTIFILEQTLLDQRVWIRWWNLEPDTEKLLAMAFAEIQPGVYILCISITSPSPLPLPTFEIIFSQANKNTTGGAKLITFLSGFSILQNIYPIIQLKTCWWNKFSFGQLVRHQMFGPIQLHNRT